MGVKRIIPDTREMAPKILYFLDKIFQERKYIVDNEISVADLIIACETYQLILLDMDFSKYKYLNDYLQRINSIPEMKEINKLLETFARKINNKSPKF
jgi:glutathione S-transferase